MAEQENDLLSVCAPAVSSGERPGERGTEGDLPAVLEDGGAAEQGGALVLARYAAQAFLEYALSVVKDRALPDVFDGMKPVQRRILYSMERMRLMPPASFVKCARVVGDVLGKYHPHGDQAAYEAMVRMAQDFTLRYPLVDGEGNFGSRDGDPAAAMRYTEARLSKISELLLSELNAEDVEFAPNYDGSFTEPTVLPARMPFVLLNGASGIAVGMATEIPPHNLTETAQALELLLRRPDATLDDVLAVMPAPDFPGGGQITSSPAEIRALYASGRGSLAVRARWHFEELARGQWQLVVDELPPRTSAEKVLSEIEAITNPRPRAGRKSLTAEQQNARAAMLAVLGGVSNGCDMKTPVRLVFEPRTSKIDRSAFVEALLSQTSLQDSAPCNFVMLGLDGRPRQKPLLEILHEWIEARSETVRRRSQARLGHVRDRLHVIEGRQTAVDHVDRVIEIIRFEENPAQVLQAEFGLSEAQAEDILNLRLRQLANLEMQSLADEAEKLGEEARELERVLGSDALLRRVLVREIREAARKYGDPRRTLVEEARRVVREETPPEEEVTVILSRKGYVRVKSGHGHNAEVLSYKVGDGPGWSFETMSTGTLAMLASNGRAFSVAVSDLPSARGDGMPVTSYLDLEPGVEIVDYFCDAPGRKLLLSTSAGFGFLCPVESLYSRQKAGKAFLKLTEGAKVLPAVRVRPTDTLLASLSEKGRLLVFPAEEFKELPGGGKGVVIQGLDEGETLLSVASADGTGLVVFGASRSGPKQKTLSGADWNSFLSHRARKGRAVPARFTPSGLRRIDDAGRPAEEEQPPEVLL